MNNANDNFKNWIRSFRSRKFDIKSRFEDECYMQIVKR